jgi:hypothetical protein
MRNIMAYPISKKEVEDCLTNLINAEALKQVCGNTDGTCLQIALRIVQASNFTVWPEPLVETV